MKTLVLALGNDLLGDDGVAWRAADLLASKGGSFAVEKTSVAGLALLEYLTGYERALLLDALCSGRYPVGTVVELHPEDFGPVVGPSPHYAGLAEVFALARRIEVPLPERIAILGVEVAEPHVIREGLSASGEKAALALVERARRILDDWAGSEVEGSPI